MTDRSTTLIGLEELGPEPCDGTGEDAMSKRARRKWLKGALIGSQTSRDAELQAPGYAAFGAWFMGQCRSDPEAQRLFAMWQQSKQPARPRKKLLNPALLDNIASTVACKRLSKHEQASDVVALCTVNRQFHRTVVREWEACTLVDIQWDNIVVLVGPHTATRLELNHKLFAALWECTPRCFADVVMWQNPDALELYATQFTGIERLDVSGLSTKNTGELAMDRLAYIIENNKDSLKVLKMSTSLLNVLPHNLKLEKFVADIFDELHKFQGPWTLDTKVFEGHGGKTPPEFLRALHADEVHLDVGIWSNERHPLPPEPSNSRTKKLIITTDPQHEGDFHFDRIVRDVAIMCPSLEYLEVAYKHHFRRNGNDDPDYLQAKFEHAVKECGSPAFRICLNAFFDYYAGTKQGVSDFARDYVNDVDLPPICRAHEGRPHYHLVKETSFGTKCLRMNFKLSVDDEPWSSDWSTQFTYEW
ncbi:hypothetical protein AAVH_20338 [Aphelenchoides avenae]|nr:hypothetical protein AAVH_20338 [Aphelenchus avenae]